MRGIRVQRIRVKEWGVTAEGLRRALALGASLALAGCTLTQDSFEPRRIEAEQTRSEGLAPDGPSSSAAEPAGGTPNTPSATTRGQELPGEVELAAAEGAERGEGQLGAEDVAKEGAEVSAPAVDGGAAREQPSNPSDGDPSDGDLPPDAGALPALEPCSGLTRDGSCYEFFAELAAWPVAEQACVTWGGHLASVASAAEDTFLARWPLELGVPSGNGAGIWLGASDSAQDGVFQWTDGSGFAFPGWGAGQPDNGPSVADCVEKRNDGATAWHDRHCTDPLAYVCERPL